jgi:peptidoglycan/xylan/chitin deacetylase (PgdA/CDA1 family)
MSDFGHPDSAGDAAEPPVVSRRAMLGAGAALAAALTACGATAPGQPASSASESSPGSASGTRPTHRPAGPKRSARATAAAPSGPAHEVARGTGRRPEVALTFHGAGDPALATQILSILHDRGAHASILAVGTWLAANPSFADKILTGGHELGNHTWSHPTLANLDRSAVQTEIERCRDLLVRLTGSDGAHFRQSGGQHSTPLIRELAGAAGYPVCLSYDVDSLDWTDPGPAAIVRNMAATGAGSVVSLHLGHPGTVTALPAVLDDLQRRGLRPVTATELLRA